MDSLTKYFTPGAKRTSRTALNSLIKPARELQDSPQGSSSNLAGGSSLKKRKKSSEAKLFSSGSERDETENISLSQMKKKSRRIKSKFAYYFF